MEFEDPDRTEVFILVILGVTGLVSFVIQNFL